MRHLLFRTLVLVPLIAGGFRADSQTASQAWLKYRPLGKPLSVPSRVNALGKSLLEQTAAIELRRGLLSLSSGAPLESGPNTILVGTVQEFRARHRETTEPSLEPDEFIITARRGDLTREIDIIGGSDHAILYGVFTLLRNLAQGVDMSKAEIRERPAMPIRWVDEWDNADGSIERGYAGRSIFFDDGRVREDLAPVGEYARLLASVGINGCNLNNVNGSSPFLTSEMLQGVARIAEAMRPYGVRVSLSVDIASPQKIGGLSTYDPLDPAVKNWWATKVNEIYALIPDFAGFTVKADCEGQPGPASFGRTPADAANTLAAALAPHSGVVLYRAFVYNHHLDWRDPKADRARAAYDIFHPARWQVRAQRHHPDQGRPHRFPGARARLAALRRPHPNQPGHGAADHAGVHRPAAPPRLSRAHVESRCSTSTCASAMPINAGEDKSSPAKRSIVRWAAWSACPVSAGRHGSVRRWLLANLYAFGRLAWDPNLTPEQIADEWTRQTIQQRPCRCPHGRQKC